VCTFADHPRWRAPTAAIGHRSPRGSRRYQKWSLNMGKVALAAKITHVPSMYLSELEGPRKGSRQDAIDGHKEIARRCKAAGVDTIVVFDTHWLVNANYHINCAPHFKGLYTSNELPHFIANMPFETPGNPALGQILARSCNAMGVETLAHDRTTLDPEYGTLVPMRYMNADQHFKVVSVSALCTVHYLNDSARLGWAMRKAVEDHYDGTVAFLASGSLSHRFAQNGLAPEYAFKIWSPFLEELDHHVVRMWQQGQWKAFCEMLPEYASKGHGEGFMHDTAMLLGLLGWSAYDGKAEVITPYFGASGTGQINAVFPVTPQDGRAIPKAQASAAEGYTSVATRL
jgi:3,4-dihydroxyphenylacetate 2,3-dioxygenase